MFCNPCRRAAPAAPLAIGILLFVAASIAAANPAAEEQHLTVDRLVERVLTNNAGLKALRAAVDAAEARIVPAGSLPDPQLSGAVAPETIGGYDSPSGRGANVRLEISQELPWPGTLGLRAEAARKEATAATENVAALRLRLAAATKTAYADWRYVHRALEINAAHQDLVAELRRVAEQRYAAGLSRQQDVLQAEVTLKHLEHQAIELERRKRAVKAKINALVNRPARKPLAEPRTLPQPRALPHYRALRERALSSHPELTSVQRRVAANRDREALARKDFYPDFKVFSGYNGLWDADEKRWVVGAGISLPLSRDKYHARMDQAKADTMRLEHELADRRTRLLSQLEQAHAAAEETRHNIALFENELVPLTRENLSAARAEYGAGGGAFLAVIDAERNKLDTELSLARVRADHFAAIAELERWTAADLPATPAAGPMSTLERSHE